MEGGDLARLWKGGKKGCLSPLMQAKAWGLRDERGGGQKEGGEAERAQAKLLSLLPFLL